MLHQGIHSNCKYIQMGELHEYALRMTHFGLFPEDIAEIVDCLCEILIVAPTVQTS